MHSLADFEEEGHYSVSIWRMQETKDGCQLIEKNPEYFLSLEDFKGLNAANNMSLEASPSPILDENPALTNTLTATLQKAQLSQAWTPHCGGDKCVLL